MQGYKIDFSIYAENQEEVDLLKEKICMFIEEHRKAGRAVTAKKLSDALGKLDSNIFIKNQINNFFLNKR